MNWRGTPGYTERDRALPATLMLRTRIIATTTAAILVSAVFASALTFVNRADTFVEPLRVRPGEPAPVTLRIPWTRVHQVETDIASRAPVIERGSVVEDPVVAALVSAFEEQRRPPKASDLFGLWFIYFLIALMVTTYMRDLSPGRGALLRTQLGLLGLALGLLAVGKALLLFTPVPVHALPVSAVALWAALYLDRRTAVIVALAMAALTGSLAGFRLSSVAVFLAAGVVAVLALKDRKRAIGTWTAGGISALASGGVYVAAQVIFDGGFDFFAEIEDPARSSMIASIAGALLGAAVALIFGGVAVVILGAVSRTRLVELSDLDQPLLVKIAKEAPGSWEHSRAMANLAEAAANSIGADALLTRVGAYYHDLGKSCQAKYFVENLTPGEQTPHKHLPPDLSADAIMAHVVEGVNILRRGKIPEPVVEFAYTHHGTSIIEYFWHRCVEEGNPNERDESFFRYPGMRPRTKETAILMLVDSIEAASRTIDPPTMAKFEEMVQRILFVKLRQGQLDESGLTLKELRVIANQIVDSLCSMYHSRIRYPWQDRKEGESSLPMPGIATEDDVAKARARAAESTADGERRAPPSEPEVLVSRGDSDDVVVDAEEERELRVDDGTPEDEPEPEER